MIWNNILGIVDHWRGLFAKADESKQATLKDRIEEVRVKQLVRMDDAYNIIGTCGDHHQEITPRGHYCTCHAYNTSAPTGEDKKPCKHLYALASGVMRNF